MRSQLRWAYSFKEVIHATSLRRSSLKELYGQLYFMQTGTPQQIERYFTVERVPSGKVLLQVVHLRRRMLAGLRFRLHSTSYSHRNVSFLVWCCACHLKPQAGRAWHPSQRSGRLQSICMINVDTDHAVEVACRRVLLLSAISDSAEARLVESTTYDSEGRNGNTQATGSPQQP